MKRKLVTPITFKRPKREQLHVRANYARDPRSRFRCPGCVAGDWYKDGLLPDPASTTGGGR